VGPRGRLQRDLQPRRAAHTRALGGTPAPNTITGFRWEANNEHESDWRPQGITGSADGYPGGAAGPYKVLITSW
jgi:hypothetical protein